MARSSIEWRSEQARRELGMTRVSRGAAWMFALVWLATVVGVPLVEEARRQLSPDERALALVELPASFAQAVDIARTHGVVAADLHLLAELDRVETRLEDESFLRALLLPRVQRLFFAALGLGNEQVYPGHDGWLFLRTDLDHVTGQGFLEPNVLQLRARGGKSWEPAPHPDPRPALRELHDSLAERGIELIVMPTPVKPTVHPERFSKWRSIAPVTNPSYPRLVEELRAAGIRVFEPLDVLVNARSAEPLYLRADTHWTPASMDRVTAALAGELSVRPRADGEPARYSERELTVEGRGDLAAMLRLPAAGDLIPAERVGLRMVLESDGRSWRPSREGVVLVLGDSFTNVFSDGRLGWGSGAGLAERLSLHLGAPVDRVAVNAGGALATREALARELASDPGRLDGKRFLVYQFATRELSFGDWKPVDLRP